MRQLAIYATVLAVGTGVAHAGWSEYSDAVPSRPFEQLTETGCDVSLQLRGGIVEGELRLRIENAGPSALAAVTDIELPAGALVTGMVAGRDTALAVAAPLASEGVPRSGVLGADPALLTRIDDSERGRPQVRLVVQPIASEATQSVTLRWSTPAEIRDGALHITLPGRGENAARCRGLVSVMPGPGARVERIRLDSTELGTRSTAAFELGATDATLAAVLAFTRGNQPVVWTQTAALGDGLSAQAVTVMTPAARSASARRVLLVIDGSRSMELVGRHNVGKLVHAIGGALPAGSEVEAVIFDRSASRVLGSWRKVSTDAIDAIAKAVATHPATNGSDTAAAFTYAKSLIGDGRGQTQIVLVTDGVLGDVPLDTLTKALGASPLQVDVHAIALAPGRMSAPDTGPLRAAVNDLGGSFVEVATTDIDTALASVDEWLRPAWHELAIAGGATGIPEELRAGTGVVRFDIVKRAASLTLTGHGEKVFRVTSAAAPAAAFAQLALAEPGETDESTRAKLRERHVAVDDIHALAVLASGSAVATNRRKMVAGGGPYTRLVDVKDLAFERVPKRAGIPGLMSVIDRQTLTLLLRQYLQPAAFVCYQKALGRNGELAGTVKFTLEIGRGELTRASVIGTGDAAFDACLLEAAYQITPPLPNPDINIDDRTIVNYPLTFSVREQKAYVVPGDADSSSPLDIDAIQGGVPLPPKGRTIKAGDTSTPLGGLRPAPSP